jgi:hypothetical protein
MLVPTSTWVCGCGIRNLRGAPACGSCGRPASALPAPPGGAPIGRLPKSEPGPTPGFIEPPLGSNPPKPAPATAQRRGIPRWVQLTVAVQAVAIGIAVGVQMGRSGGSNPATSAKGAGRPQAHSANPQPTAASPINPNATLPGPAGQMGSNPTGPQLQAFNDPATARRGLETTDRPPGDVAHDATPAAAPVPAAPGLQRPPGWDDSGYKSYGRTGTTVAAQPVRRARVSRPADAVVYFSWLVSAERQRYEALSVLVNAQVGASSNSRATPPWTPRRSAERSLSSTAISSERESHW